MYQLSKSVIGTEGRNPHHLLWLSLVPKGEICTICFICHWYRREKSTPFALVVIGTEGRNPFHYHHLLWLSLVPKGEIRIICFGSEENPDSSRAGSGRSRLMAIAFPALAIAFR